MVLIGLQSHCSQQHFVAKCCSSSMSVTNPSLCYLPVSIHDLILALSNLCLLAGHLTICLPHNFCIIQKPFCLFALFVLIKPEKVHLLPSIQFMTLSCLSKFWVTDQKVFMVGLSLSFSGMPYHG